VVLALVLPWPIAGVTGPQHAGDPSIASGVAVGLWAHVMVVPPALGLGAWASRAVSRSYGKGAAILVAGTVFAFVLGLRDSPLWWLAPPLLSAARLAQRGFLPLSVAALSVQAVAWSAVVLGGYARLRRRWS